MPRMAAIRGQETRRQRVSRAFRPLACWLLISLFLLAWDFHTKNVNRTTLNFKVTIEGNPVEHDSDYQATIGKWRVGPGLVAPIGWRTLKVTVPDAEPYEKRLFIWYGTNRTDDIDFQWKRGALAISSDLPVKKLELVGPHYRFSLTNSTDITVTIPVGTYRATATFERLVETYLIEVREEQTNQFSIRPSLGSLELSTQPEKASFRLRYRGTPDFLETGESPALLQGLPAGKYDLQVSRGDYVKESSLTLRKWLTNRVNTAFEYGTVEVNSQPEGVSIFIGKTQLGTTPATLTEIRPGTQKLRLEKVGFGTIEIPLEISPDTPLSVSTNLFSVRYLEAMANVRKMMASRTPDFHKALAMADLALIEHPADAAASELRDQFIAAVSKLDEQEALRRKSAQVATRVRNIKQAFDQTTSGIRHSDLFDTHQWEFASRHDLVRDAATSALPGCDPSWEIESQQAIDTDATLLTCTPKGVSLPGKRCVILIAQVDEGRVQVMAKFWDYILGEKVSISVFRGVTQDSVTPIHRRFFSASQGASIDERRRNIAESFHTRLQNALR